MIVLDDNSSDATPQILAEIAGRDERLRLYFGRKFCLPVGRARIGPVINCPKLPGVIFCCLWTPIPICSPTALNATVGALKDNQTGLLSALPAEETVTWGEKFIVPIIHWAIFCIMPLMLAFKKRIPALSVSHGQYMCFTKEAYQPDRRTRRCPKSDCRR